MGGGGSKSLTAAEKQSFASRIPQTPHPVGYYVLPYFEYKWYNSMNAKQCGYVTTPPSYAAQCPAFSTSTKPIPLNCQLQTFVSADNNFEDVGPRMTYTDNITDEQVLADRSAVQTKIQGTSPSSHLDAKSYWCNMVYPWRANGHIVNEPSIENMDIGYSETKDVSDLPQFMPLANMLYDSTNCGPQSNAMADWNTNDTSDILTIMGGAEEFAYMLVPEVTSPSGGTLGAATSRPTSPSGPLNHVKYYPKTYAAGDWMRNLDYCNAEGNSMCGHLGPGCTFSDEKCTNTQKQVQDGGTGDMTYTLQYRGPAPPSSTWPTEVMHFNSKGPVCNTPYSIQRACDVNDSKLPYVPDNPAPPIVVTNKVVERYCRQFNQRCPSTKKCLYKKCPSNKPCLDTADGTCTAAEPDNRCKTGATRTAGLTGPQLCAAKVNGACPAGTEPATCPVASPSSSRGVCYSQTQTAMGQPAAQVCIAVPATDSNNNVDPIPPFDVQQKCFAMNKSQCQNNPPIAGTAYQCSLETIETDNACAGKSKSECTGSPCAWGVCQEITYEGGIKQCQAAQSTHTVLNSRSDPFVWTMFDQFQKAPDKQMHCPERGVTCTNAGVMGLLPTNHTMIPAICNTFDPASRPQFGTMNDGTPLNGFPFCAAAASGS